MHSRERLAREVGRDIYPRGRAGASAPSDTRRSESAQAARTPVSPACIRSRSSPCVGVLFAAHRARS